MKVFRFRLAFLLVFLAHFIFPECVSKKKLNQFILDRAFSIRVQKVNFNSNLKKILEMEEKVLKANQQ